MNAIALWVGYAALTLGGVAVVAGVGWVAVDRVLRFWMNSAAIIRIMDHARHNGLNLATGKKTDPETLAH